MPDVEEYISRPGDDNENGKDGDGSESCDSIIVEHKEGNKVVGFFPTWQETKSAIFDVQVKNVNESGRRRKIKITVEPRKIGNMRGDGHCLFRAFSGVQSYHKQMQYKLSILHGRE
jgi:hypothetical protein